MTIFAISALPYHMVRQVAKYVCEYKSELNMDGSGKEPVDPLITLLHICHDWRQVTLPMIFGSGSFCIADDCELGIIYSRYKNGILECIDQSYTAYIQHLSIYVSMDKVIRGESLGILTASKVGGFVFPSLKRVTFCISDYQKTQLECPNANSNIRKLVQHISQMLPALELIELEYSIVNITMFIRVDTHKHSMNVVDELADTLSDIYLKNNTLLGCKTKCNLLVAGLTSLSILWRADYSIVSNVIYACSQSLQKLKISYLVYDGIEELVHRHDSKQEYMCYPQLAELSLTSIMSTQVNIVPPTGNAIVFPRLCELAIGFGYPFSDNVLFRGNQWTLESIDIVLDTQAMMQLSSDGVFNKGNMVALKNVVISSHDGTTRDTMLNSLSKNFFQGLLSSSHSLAIAAESYHDMLIDSINCKTQYHKLRYLRLGSSKVTFENIVVLLQALPQLSYLSSTMSSLGNKYSEMKFPKVLKHMQASFNPLNKSFNTWSIYNLESEAVGIVSTCIMLLIDQCPNFHTVVFHARSYNTPIKIHQQLLRASPRIPWLNANKNENLQFKISFAPSKAALQIIRKSL